MTLAAGADCDVLVRQREARRALVGRRSGILVYVLVGLVCVVDLGRGLRCFRDG